MQGEGGSVMAVFTAVAQCGELSRAQISDITGYSLMTVGKAVDLLEESGVFVQHKQSSGSVGRRMNVSMLNTDCGMIVYDLTAETPRIRILDLAFNLCGDYIHEENGLGELTVAGFGYFMESVGGELAGIACVVPDGTRDEYAKRFREALGHAPEVIIESTRAYAAAGAIRLDSHGMALQLRLHEDGTVKGAVTYGKKLYTGAHGNAGNFEAVMGSGADFARKVGELCALMDPETVHIACQRECDCAAVEAEIKTALTELDITADASPNIIAEPVTLCRSAYEGAALLLREKYILSKIPNNT